MKYQTSIRRFGALILAILMTLSALTACKGGGEDRETDPVAGETSPETEDGTTEGTPSVDNPRDIPKEGAYITTTDLVLPD